MRPCRNRRCDDLAEGRYRFCPSCRLAMAVGYRRSAAVAVLVGVGWRLVGPVLSDVDFWLAPLKRVLFGVFGA